MSVDYITCAACGDNFPDCGPWTQCVKEHAIGPCCLQDPEDDEICDDDGLVLCEHCPACKAGGSEREQIAALKSRLADASKEIGRIESAAVQWMDECKRLKERLAEVERDRDKWQLECQVNHAMRDDAENENGILKAERDEAQATVESLSANFARLTAERSALALRMTVPRQIIFDGIPIRRHDQPVNIPGIVIEEMTVPLPPPPADAKGGGT